MERDEFLLKIKLCATLGITPRFRLQDAAEELDF